MAAVPADPQPPSPVPNHLAIIMDGNGRWARQRALPRASGHKAGIKPVRATVEYCAAHGVRQLTLFAFSSENWKRPPDEVRGLMRLFIEALNREVDELDRNGIRLAFMVGAVIAMFAFIASIFVQRPAPQPGSWGH